MTPQTLEARVARLEQQMDLLLSGRTDGPEPSPDDWKQTVGIFRGDPIVAEMIEGARQIREEDRRRARETKESGPA